MYLTLLLAASLSASTPEKAPADIPQARQDIAAQYDSAEPYVQLEGSVLYYVGAISRLGLEKVKEQLSVAQSKPRYLMVDSVGGDLIAGAELAEAIHVSDMHVVVFRKGCASSCANYLFVPAGRKTIMPGALVVWHDSCVRNFPTDQETILRSFDRGTLKTEGFERQFIVEHWDKFVDYRDRLSRAHDRVYAGTGIDDRITCLAADVFDVPFEMYTMGVKEMEWFGVCNVDAPSDYIDVARRIFRKQVPANFGIIEPAMVQAMRSKEAKTKCGHEAKGKQP